MQMCKQIFVKFTDFDTSAGTKKQSLVPVTGNPSPVTQKLIINDHVIIIRNGERYDVTGKKLE